jgi:hypothetical protein
MVVSGNLKVDGDLIVTGNIIQASTLQKKEAKTTEDITNREAGIM